MVPRRQTHALTETDVAALTIVSGIAMSTVGFAQTGASTGSGARNPGASSGQIPGSSNTTNRGGTDSRQGQTGSGTTGASPGLSGAGQNPGTVNGGSAGQGVTPQPGLRPNSPSGTGGSTR
jgi:hypothetical protein